MGAATEKHGGLVSRAFQAIGLGGLPGLAQLGGALAGIDSRLAAAWKTATLFLTTITGVGRLGVQAADALVRAFGGANVIGAIGGLVGHAASAATQTIGRALGGVLASVMESAAGTAIGAVAGILGTGVAAVVGTLGAPLLILGGLAGVLAGGFLAAAAAGTGLAIALSHVASEGAASIASLSVLSREVGVNVHALSGLANTAGLNPEGFTHSMLHMQRSIEEGSTGAARALNQMGLSLAELRDQSPIQQLESIYGAFRNLETQGERASAAMALFGRSGIQMLDSLGRGTEGLNAARQRAERFGLTFTENEANLVRQSLRAWGQWSLAMEGVSRKLAVIFAPAWEELGNIGGAIGERLVALVSDREVVQSVHGLWRGIADAGTAAWDGITEAVRAFWQDTLGLSLVSGDQLKDVFIKSMVAAEFIFRNIGPLAQQGWNELKLAGLETADAIASVINSIVRAFEDALARVADGFNQTIRNFNNSWGSSVLGRIEELRAPSFSLIDTTGLADQLRELRAVVAEGRTDIVDNLVTFMESRTQQIQAAARVIGNVADTAVQAAGAAAQVGARLTPGGNAASLAGSQEAFSILNNRQADLNAVMREHLETTRRIEQIMRDQLMADRSRPVVAVVGP